MRNSTICNFYINLFVNTILYRMTNKSRDNKYCDENEERSRTFQTLRESLLGAPSGWKDFSTVKKIREKIHFNLMNGTPSPLGKALVTLTTESSKDKMQLICIDDLNYNTDHEYRDTVSIWCSLLIIFRKMKGIFIKKQFDLLQDQNYYLKPVKIDQILQILK